MKKSHLLQFAVGLCFVIGVAAIGNAEEVNFGEAAPSVDAVVNALQPDARPEMKLRGINYNPAPPKPKMVSFSLEFEKNSAELTQKTKKNLATLGQALNSGKLNSLTFTLEGHADASGSADHNLSLSQQRAAAVKKYLVENHHVQPGNLKVVGKGENEPLDPSDPYAAKNRRVRIVTNQ